MLGYDVECSVLHFTVSSGLCCTICTKPLCCILYYVYRPIRPILPVPYCILLSYAVLSRLHYTKLNCFYYCISSIICTILAVLYPILRYTVLYHIVLCSILYHPHDTILSILYRLYCAVDSMLSILYPTVSTILYSLYCSDYTLHYLYCPH